MRLLVVKSSSYPVFLSSFLLLEKSKDTDYQGKGGKKIRSDEKNGAGRNLGQMVTAPIRLAREIETILLHLGAPWGPLAASCWVPDLAEQRLRLEVVVPPGPGRRLGSAGSGGSKCSGSF